MSLLNASYTRNEGNKKAMPNSYKNLHIVAHPLVQHKLTYLRDKNTNSHLFRQLLHEIALLLFYETTRNLLTKKQVVATPTEDICEGQILAAPNPVIIPILRAGLTMVDAFLTLIPNSKIGHIGLARDEEKQQTHCYYFNIPVDSAERSVYICDPILATGGSAIMAVNMLQEKGVQDITLTSIIAAPEGMNRFNTVHPNIPVITAALDRELNAKSFVLPGLGDAGDRAFGTKNEKNN